LRRFTAGKLFRLEGLGESASWSHRFFPIAGSHAAGIEENKERAELELIRAAECGVSRKSTLIDRVVITPSLEK
jgi:hypothetical protein